MNVAVLHLLYGNHPSDTSWFVHLLKWEDVVTLLLMQHSSHFALVLPSRHVFVDKPYFRRQCRRNRIHCNHYHLSILWQSWRQCPWSRWNTVRELVWDSTRLLGKVRLNETWCMFRRQDEYTFFARSLHTMPSLTLAIHACTV
jgi:hypothetical protein